MMHIRTKTIITNKAIINKKPKNNTLIINIKEMSKVIHKDNNINKMFNLFQIHNINNKGKVISRKDINNSNIINRVNNKDISNINSIIPNISKHHLTNKLNNQ